MLKPDHRLIAHTYHAGSGPFSNEGIPKDLRQSAHAERNVIAVLSQWPNALLQIEEPGSGGFNNLNQNLDINIPAQILLLTLPGSREETSPYLQCQQAAVDLCSLHQNVAVVAADVRASLIASQIHQWKFAVQRGGTVVAAEDDLKDGVRAGGVGVGRGLSWRPEEKNNPHINVFYPMTHTYTI